MNYVVKVPIKILAEYLYANQGTLKHWHRNNMEKLAALVTAGDLLGVNMSILFKPNVTLSRA